MYSETSSFPKGLNYPVMFIEPNTDTFSSTYSNPIRERAVVGARASLQTIIRETPLNVRSLTVFVDNVRSYHQTGNSSVLDSSLQEIITLSGIQHPNKPTFPNTDYDPVFGFGKGYELYGTINMANQLGLSVYFRSLLSTFEDINLNALNFLPFDYKVCPWTIPGADDYQWRRRLYSQDIGGQFQMRLDTDTQLLNFVLEDGVPVTNPVTGIIPDEGELFYDFKVNDPLNDDVIEIFMESVEGVVQQFTSTVFLLLYSESGQLLQRSSDPSETIRFNLSEVEDKSQTFYIRLLNRAFVDSNFQLGLYSGVYETVLSKSQPLAVPPTQADNAAQMIVKRKTLNITNIPSSSVGLSQGDLYLDGDIIKVVL